MDTYSPIATMNCAMIESCSMQMLKMVIATTITHFCGLICKFTPVNDNLCGLFILLNTNLHLNDDYFCSSTFLVFSFFLL